MRAKLTRMSLSESVSSSLDALAPDARDDAARFLARYYAATIDDNPDQLEQLGPKLLVTLEALGLTPRARSAATQGAPSAGTNPLDQLRDRRARRDSGSVVDPATG